MPTYRNLFGDPVVIDFAKYTDEITLSSSGDTFFVHEDSKQEPDSYPSLSPDTIDQIFDEWDLFLSKNEFDDIEKKWVYVA